MANLQHASSDRTAVVSAISNIADARRRRDRVGEIADWVVSNIPWSVAVPDWHGFHDRWPLLSRADLAAVEDELRRRGDALNDPVADLGAIAARLCGRLPYWTAAADWLTLNRSEDVTHPEFVRLFGQMSRAELILAAIELKRRLQRR